MHTMWARLGLAAASGVIAAAVPPPPPAQTTALRITNVRVFDGTRVRAGMDVVVENGVIRSVERSSGTASRLPAIDGSGRTLIPGLIDAHAHPAAPLALQDSVRFGVTTMLGMGVTTTADEPAVRAAAAGRHDVADYRSAGTPATAPDAHGTFGDATTVATPSDADAFVAARKAAGADYLKIILNGVRTTTAGIPNMREDVATALVRAAHARGMLVIAHIESLQDVRVALASGVDGLAHLWREDAPAGDLIARIVRQRVFVIPTIAIPDALVPGSLAALASDRRIEPFLTPAMKARLLRSPTGPVLPDVNWRLAAIGLLHKAGARLLTGTDADDGTRSSSGVHLHRELELLVKSGLTPSEALAAATANIADAFRLADRGRIAPGRRADLVLVQGDPTVDITVTRDIVHVWRSGGEVDRRREGR